jgi:starch phosphorylase
MFRDLGGAGAVRVGARRRPGSQAVDHAVVHAERRSDQHSELCIDVRRALREYTERYYLLAARAFATRSAHEGEEAARVVDWERTMRSHWPLLRFGHVEVRTEGGRHAFAATVYIDDIDPDSVAIELYADAASTGGGPSRTPMRREEPLVGARGFLYRAEVNDDRPAAHFTPRAIPSRSGVSIPLELPLIAWAS